MEKLLYEGSKLIGTAGLSYAGPKKWLLTPEDFNFDRMADYVVANAKLLPLNMFDILEDMLDDIIEAKARERNYGSKYTSATQSLVGYKDDEEPRYATEAAIFIAWRSSLFSKCYWLMEQVYYGNLPMPKGLVDVLPHVTILNWSDHDIPPLRASAFHPDNQQPDETQEPPVEDTEPETDPPVDNEPDSVTEP